MDILDDMGVSKLSANVFSKANYSFNASHIGIVFCMLLNMAVVVFSLQEYIHIFYKLHTPHEC